MGKMTAPLMLAAVLSVGPNVAMGQTNDDKAAADLVATQVRDQGYACEEPTSASQDPDSEGDTVWTLSCANASYRVRLVPDMAAQIEQIN